MDCNKIEKENHTIWVSVVIPAYNCGRYIKDTVQSVINQTYKNLEIIVVDDGSVDNTKEALEPYRGKIVYSYQENKGLAEARNTGIRASKGEYVAFLDADDLWLQEKIEKQLELFRNCPEVDIVFSDFSAFTQEKEISSSWIKEYFEVFLAYGLTFEKIFAKKINKNSNCYVGDICKTMFLGNFILPSTVLMKRKCFDNIGYLDRNYRINADYDLFLRITSKHIAGYTNAPLTRYRLWEGNVSKTKSYQFNIAEITGIIQKFIKTNHETVFAESYRVNKRLSQLFFQNAIANISGDNYRKAKEYIRQSINYNPFCLKLYLFSLLLVMPEQLVNFLKIIRKKARK